jgi:hypothetical protein
METETHPIDDVILLSFPFILVLALFTLIILVLENDKIEPDISNSFLNPIKSRQSRDSQTDYDYLCYYTYEY